MVPDAERLAARAARRAAASERWCSPPTGREAAQRPPSRPQQADQRADLRERRRDPGRRRGASGSRAAGRAPGARAGAPGGAWRAAPARPRPWRRRRGAPDGDARGPHPAPPARAEPLAHAHERALGRMFLRRRAPALCGAAATEHSVRESIAELVQEAADAPQEPGVAPELDRQERALIANVLRLRGTTADDVMIPRADIVAMPVDVTLDQALEQIRREGHSRMPVFREQLDDIVGMVHIKDVFGYVGRPDAFQLEASCGAAAGGAAGPGAGPAAADAPGPHPPGPGGGRIWRHRRAGHHRGPGRDHHRRHRRRA